jgi:YidC/Oxa1 family membrane protein insertase
LSIRQRQIVSIFLLLAFVTIALAGCAPSPNQFGKLDPEHSLWDRYLVSPMSGLLDFFKQVLGNYGWSILVVTFIVRLAVLPLTWKQQKSTKAMQKLQPQLTKIREKHKKNPQKLQEETMKLFQANNVNPMAGCLPLLIQFPILIAFYQAIMGNEHIALSNFLYLELGKADPYLILPLLAAVTTYIQFIVTGANSNPQMKMMLIVMPIMIFILAYQFPAALSLYWVYGNIFTILQYVFLFGKNKENMKQEGVTR